MNTDAAILKEQAKALDAEVRKVIETYLDIRNWVALFTMLGDIAIKRQDTKVVGIMMYAVQFLTKKG